MNLDSAASLSAAITGGLLAVTMFHYGAQLLLRLVEIPIPALPLNFTQTTTAFHDENSSSTVAPSQVDAAEQEPMLVGVLVQQQGNRLRASRA
jgi:hypothetical protein